MTKALNHAIVAFVPKLNHVVVFAAFKDQRCSVCPLASYGARVQLVASDSCVDTYGGEFLFFNLVAFVGYLVLILVIFF